LCSLVLGREGEQGWPHEFEGVGQCIGRWGGVNTVEILKFEKGGGVHDPLSSYGGAAPEGPLKGSRVK